MTYEEAKEESLKAIEELIAFAMVIQSQIRQDCPEYVLLSDIGSSLKRLDASLYDMTQEQAMKYVMEVSGSKGETA